VRGVREFVNTVFVDHSGYELGVELKTEAECSLRLRRRPGVDETNDSYVTSQCL